MVDNLRIRWLTIFIKSQNLINPFHIVAYYINLFTAEMEYDGFIIGSTTNNSS